MMHLIQRAVEQAFRLANVGADADVAT